ncbi:chlorophyll synthase ChlG [Salinarimonas soli]|uniref:Chlorophyll synthase ChlG n=1 Tax=Salinarimonas soli TaxID=1638099 RepID=A0A5B2VIB6_9HYPH|nr:chlorophyll synthase ChlG [Salinarimonas soli]KAA2238092.1 chlorophyll synthase ChlG [Salinarimonas soli]
MARPSLSAVAELLKPITWFAPMWAFACGVVSSGVGAGGRWPLIVLGVLLAGPLICAASQAANDWYDRFVDAINEPGRPIPSGRIPGRWGFYIALAWTALSFGVAVFLGPWALAAGTLGLVLAWAYSAPPIRLKRNGWWGNTAVAVSYEGLPWFTGAAVMAAGFPDPRVLLLAALYSVGAHGIMTLNDFKSVEGDRRTGIDSLPVTLGVARAARFACWVMAVPQAVVVGFLWAWGQSVHALVVAGLLAFQALLMRRLLADPRGQAAWYNATGTTLYVLGMLVAAFAARALTLAGG